VNRSRAVLAALPAFLAAPAPAQWGGILSYPPIDTSALMPRADAEVTIAGFETRITALEAGRGRFLTDVTLAQTALLSVQLAGVREFTVATNCQVGDRLFMTPSDTAPPPAGFMLGDIRCVSAGVAQAKLFLPQLLVGTAYSITAKVTAFR
jgi:hypothetical protein